jgi:DNA-binding GntR family transcriptional regulator
MDKAGDLARERASDQLRHDLAGGRWPPGTVLQEGDLAQELGLSKTPVREALLALSEHGLVRPQARVGYLVPAISLRDLAEIFSLRELLEGQIAADVATAHRTAAPLAEPAAGPLAWREHAFHADLATLSGNRRVVVQVGTLLDESQRAQAYLDPAHERTPSLVAEHEPLLAAIAAGDRMLAAALMTIHLTHMRESLMASLRQRLREQSDVI